ncbi:hypothetical protein CN428_04570 [Bacillus cereus]|uniref:hypothetical protein n=1 Tax=Bacillus nitratireducens TaxID=2026193 RepID=UPI000BF7E9C5|nr:hypothetical protein CN428_04570 [Bacillus cereus]PFA30088.1 hypothetical protein CN390_21900 [Bacillus cereus]
MRKINKIERIKIENVKGKDLFELKFNELHANFPSLFVAPNGFGKSTLATTFKALKPNKIELDKEDLFEGDDKKLPSLELELVLDNVGKSTLVANTTKNEIHQSIDTYVITNPVYAKSTSRSFGKFSSQSARLDVEDLVIIDNIPSKVEIQYKLKEIKEKYGERGKVFTNISEVFKNLKNLKLLCFHYELLNKCSTQKRPQTAITDFINRMVKIGSAKAMKESITSDDLKLLQENPLISSLLQIVKDLEELPHDKENKIELILTFIQIIEVIKEVRSDIKKAKAYLEYVQYRKYLDSRLYMFNTTGRTIKTKETKGKLVIEFFAANKMSNGERDVLSFISNLSKFKVKFTKNTGILIIDEIFDYLDGSNMLIVQYFLSQLIEDYKRKGKILFPIILTHLDPILFNNYYFNKPKIHYLKNYSYTENKSMLELLKIRSNKVRHRELAENLEKYYLHYHPESFQFAEEEKALISDTNYHDSALFYELIHNEIEKFLNDKKYDPLKIICAIRVKIEKIIFDNLTTNEQKTKFTELHATIKKLNYAVEQGINVPEEYFLLQPLYNDALHLNENANATKNKIQSICLKLDNIVVQEIIRRIQTIPESNLVLSPAL